MTIALDLFLAWFGIVCTGLAVYLASMTLVDAWRRREKRRATEVVVAHVAGVVREQLRHRRVVELSARQGGKLEAQRAVVGAFLAGGGVVFTPPAPSFRDLQPKFWRKYPGEFIIGERLRLESYILDGENGPAREEPAGIFNSKPADPATLSATMHLSPAQLEELHDFIQSPKI